MENKFAEAMSNRSDSELMEIVTKFKNDYQAEAIIAAENEIKKRNLSSDQLEIVKEEIKTKELSELEKAEDPLGVGQKILFFIFFWGIIPWAMAGTFKANGYLRKYKDAWKFMKFGLLGFLAFFGLMILIAYLNLK